MKLRLAAAFLRACLGPGLLPSAAVAQTAAPAPAPWPKVVVRAGALIADIGSDLRIDGSNGTPGTNIDLENVLGFDTQATTAFVDGMWRISHRNRLLFDYERINRDVIRSTPSQTFTFRGNTFTA